MMDAIKAALKNHMMKHGHKTGHELLEGSAKEELMESPSDEKKEQESDLAPNLHKEGPGGDAIQGDGKTAHQIGAVPAVQPTADDGKQAMHQKIMEALMGKGSALGRSANSLSERAHDKQKEKMASIMKHKQQG